MALYNPCDLNNVHQLDVWVDVSDAQYGHNELDNTLLLAHILTDEYVARYITLLFQKVILLHNVLA